MRTLWGPRATTQEQTHIWIPAHLSNLVPRKECRALGQELMVAEEHGLSSLHFGQGRVAGLTLVLCGVCRSRSIVKSEMASAGAGTVGGGLGFDLHSTGWSRTPGKQRQKAARPPRGQPGTGPASFPWHSMVKASHRALLMREAARTQSVYSTQGHRS